MCYDSGLIGFQFGKVVKIIDLMVFVRGLFALTSISQNLKRDWRKGPNRKMARMGANSLNRKSQDTIEVQSTCTAKDLIRKLTVLAVAETSPVSSSHPLLAEGDVLFSADVDGVRCMLTKTVPEPGPKVCFSPREEEIARMVAKGYPNKTIAGVLEISVWTVNTHLRRIFGKLGVNSRAAMVGQMSGLGLLKESPVSANVKSTVPETRSRRPPA
jgi:two-component system nitrate/nitrite response regulator NarL